MIKTLQAITKQGWSLKPKSAGRVLTGRNLQAAREKLFAANPYCVHCKQRGIRQLAEERDHITPLCDGGTDDADNTQGLCIPCHKAKTQAESNRARGLAGKPVMRTGTGTDGIPTDTAHHWHIRATPLPVEGGRPRELEPQEPNPC